MDGLAYLSTRLTIELPDSDKVQKLMSQASRMGMTVREDFSLVSIECLSRHLEEALRVAAAVIQAPLYTGVRIDNIKKIMKIQARAEDDDSVSVAHRASLKAAYGPSGYGSALYGTDASLRGIDKKASRSFYNRLFTMEEIFFCVSSDLDLNTVRELLQKSFRGFPKADPYESTAPPASPVFPDEREIFHEKQATQSFVGNTFLLPPVSPRIYAKSLLLEVILGRGPGSRLWNLRSKDRLAYTVSAQITWTRNSGLLEAYLETDNDNVEKASRRLKEIFQGLAANGLSETELESNKTLTRARFLRSRERKDIQVRTMALYEILGLGLDFYSRVIDEVRSIELDEMNDFIRDILDPGNTLKVVVGPGRIE
jgi:predicted Zn-dependent peptidase